MVMTVAENMQKLAGDIIVSSDIRLKAVGDMVADTQKTLDGFSRDRKKMAARQAKDLTDFTGGLSKNVQGMLRNARKMLDRFKKDNTKISEQQAKSLADFVGGLVTDVGSTVGGFQKEQERMSSDTRKKLSKEIEDIRAEVHNILDNADKLMHDYKADMAQARNAWRKVSAALAGTGKPDSTETDNHAGKKSHPAGKTSNKTGNKPQGKAKSRQAAGNKGAERKVKSGARKSR